MLTTRPKPRALIPSTAGWHMLNTPPRLTLITCCHCSRCILRRVTSRVMPAPLTRMSSEPRSRSMRATKSAQASKSDTSSAAKVTSSPSTSARNASSRSSLPPRSTATTLRPARASEMQIAVPRPPVPPVTTAVRLSIKSPVSALALAAVAVASAGGRLADAAGQVLLQLLPHFHVALGELVHHRPRRLVEQAAHLLAELVLLLHERLHRLVQVAAHEALQRVAVEADDLAQQLGREDGRALLLVLGDDLQQHLAREVGAGLGVDHLEFLPVNDQLAHVLDGDVAGDLGVVEAAVRVLLDDAGRAH